MTTSSPSGSGRSSSVPQPVPKPVPCPGTSTIAADTWEGKSLVRGGNSRLRTTGKYKSNTCMWLRAVRTSNNATTTPQQGYAQKLQSCFRYHRSSLLSHNRDCRKGSCLPKSSLLVGKLPGQSQITQGLRLQALLLSREHSPVSNGELQLVMVRASASRRRGLLAKSALLVSVTLIAADSDQLQ